MTDNTILHEKTFAIVWGDMDALGHVNNARYFDYFQEARIEWLHQLNIPMNGTTGPVIVQTSCTFLKPVVYPAIITLHSRVQEVGHTSMVMNHDLFQGETLMAQGNCKIVWVDYRLGKSIPLPDAIKTVLPKI